MPAPADDVLLEQLDAIPGRSAGSDAERRAARLLARELRRAGLRPRTDTFWVRPAWPAVAAACCATAVAGSVASVEHPQTGLALAVAALLVFAADTTGLLRPLRRLTPERATQNVLVPVAAGPDAHVRLVVTAAIDAGRLWAGIRVRWPLAWIAGALLLTVVFAGARALDAEGTALGVAQLLPTVLLILAIGALVEAAVASPDMRAGAAPAAAVGLAAALAARPPRNLAVELLLAGAGWDHAAGVRRHLRTLRRAGTRPGDAMLLEVGSVAGAPVSGTAVAQLARWPTIATAPDAREALEHIAQLDSELGKPPPNERPASDVPARRRARRRRRSEM